MFKPAADQSATAVKRARDLAVVEALGSGEDAAGTQGELLRSSMAAHEGFKGDAFRLVRSMAGGLGPRMVGRSFMNGGNDGSAWSQSTVRLLQPRCTRLNT